MRVLIVEDESELSARLAANLSRHGVICECVENAEDARALMGETFDAMVIDLGLPGMGGLDLIQELRAKGVKTPILIFTARGRWQEKVRGLNAGADDYLVKPVHEEEMAARLQALVRRAAGHADAKITCGGLVLDPALKELTVDGAPVALTGSEYRLMLLFMYKPKQTFSLGAILDHLYPLDSERDSNTVEVLIGRLRRKIGRENIVTVRGLGYRLGS
ncbi:MAG: response regulator transcription factor [Rhodospirillaceae bacterium]|nr:response regulator transcription factor [Rhodospirillaceae bacterium]